MAPDIAAQTFSSEDEGAKAQADSSNPDSRMINVRIGDLSPWAQHYLDLVLPASVTHSVDGYCMGIAPAFGPVKPSGGTLLLARRAGFRRQPGRLEVGAHLLLRLLGHLGAGY